MSNQPPSRVPYGVTATGVQRALGERRMRRMAERGGHVDLDATMSGWPTPDPPSRPRPVVRPRRAMPGAADRPVQPPVSTMVLAELAEHAPRPPADDAPSARRRSRRLNEGAPGVPGPTGLSDSMPGRAPFTAPAASPSQLPPSTATRRSGHAEPDEPDPFAVTSRSRTEGAASPYDRVPPLERPGAAPSRRASGSKARAHGTVAPDAMTFAPVTAPAIPASATHASTGQLPAARTSPPVVVRARPDGQRGFATGPRVHPTPGDPDLAVAWETDPAQAAPPRRRRGVLLVVVGAVVLALIAAGAVFVSRNNGGVSAALQPLGDAPEQQTVLVTLLADDGSIARAALLALDDGSLVSLAMPGTLDVVVADAGTVMLSEAIKLDADAPDRGVEDTLGVRVDGTWVLDRTILTDLVDERGGVVLDVPTSVTVADVTIPAGAQTRLTGAQATAYAGAAADEGASDEAQAQFNQVLLGLLARMPTNPDEVTQVISITERNTATTVTSEVLTQVIAGAAQRIQDEVATPLLLPLTAAADSATETTLDAAGMDQLLAGALAGSALRVALVGPLRVAVQNGVDVPGLVTLARDRLVAAGLRYSGGGTAQDLGVAESVILVAEDTPENRARGEAVADALGLGAGALAVLPADQDMGDVDIVVVLGQDFADLIGSEES